jgi:hypothetical protein
LRRLQPRHPPLSPWDGSLVAARLPLGFGQRARPAPRRAGKARITERRSMPPNEPVQDGTDPAERANRRGLARGDSDPAGDPLDRGRGPIEAGRPGGHPTLGHRRDGEPAGPPATLRSGALLGPAGRSDACSRGAAAPDVAQPEHRANPTPNGPGSAAYLSGSNAAAPRPRSGATHLRNRPQRQCASGMGHPVACLGPDRLRRHRPLAAQPAAKARPFERQR